MRNLTLVLVVCAGTAAQSSLAQDLVAMRSACAADARKLCAGVQPGGGRIVACLKEHKDSLSDQCKQAAGLTESPSDSSVPSAPSVPSPTTASVDKPAAKPKSSASKSAPDKGVEKFAERVITDPDHNGMRVATVHLPEKWHFESKEDASQRPQFQMAGATGPAGPGQGAASGSLA